MPRKLSEHAMLERAIAPAVDAHRGQVDKQGEAYILHPLHVSVTGRVFVNIPDLSLAFHLGGQAGVDPALAPITWADPKMNTAYNHGVKFGRALAKAMAR